MGEMRNALVARGGLCLAAIGGNLGTWSEMAMGLKWGKPVFVLHGDLALPGAVAVASVEEMLGRVTSCLLTSSVSEGQDAR
jgi:predicted Rossmann-fold nucleotide-binding protein